MAVACASVAPPNGAGRCIGLTSFPKVPTWLACQTMGVGTFYPPRAQWELNGSAMTVHCVARYRFGSSSPANRKTSVSWSMFTTVLTNVQLAFPYPLPRHPCAVLLDALTRLRRRAVHSFERGVAFHGSATTGLLRSRAWTRSLRSRSGFSKRNKTPQAVSLLTGQRTGSTSRESV
jgi:hypothetical protein